MNSSPNDSHLYDHPCTSSISKYMNNYTQYCEKHLSKPHSTQSHPVERHTKKQGRKQIDWQITASFSVHLHKTLIRIQSSLLHRRLQFPGQLAGFVQGLNPLGPWNAIVLTALRAVTVRFVQSKFIPWDRREEESIPTFLEGVPEYHWSPTRLQHSEQKTSWPLESLLAYLHHHCCQQQHPDHHFAAGLMLDLTGPNSEISLL